MNPNIYSKSAIQRMANQIRSLQTVSTHNWDPADALYFQQHLPSGSNSFHRLPAPEKLLTMAPSEIRPHNWGMWNAVVGKLESLVRDNDPRNPKRILRDMARGKIPF